jgi:hypothetical protein
VNYYTDDPTGEVEIMQSLMGDGLWIDLQGERVGELKAILTKALSTMDPQKTPAWATWLSDKLNNMPEEATKGWYAARADK